MEVGDECVDIKAFTADMADWSITGAHKFTIRYQKSGRARGIVVCANAGCSECMQPWIRTTRILVFKLHSICFALVKSQLQAGCVELEEVSPQAVNYLRNSGLELWATDRFPGKRYEHNTSNIVESLNNWILEARKLSIVDLLHSLRCKTMELRFRHRKDRENSDARTVLTKYITSSLERSMAFINHRRIQFADGMRATVLSLQAPVPAGILNATTSHVGIPFRHREPRGGQRLPAPEFMLNNLTLEAFKATYAENMLSVDVDGLEPQGVNDCRAPLFKSA